MDSVFLVFSVTGRKGGWCWCSFVVDDVGVTKSGNVDSNEVDEARTHSFLSVRENTGFSLSPTFPLGDSPPLSLESVIRVVSVAIRGVGKARVSWLVGVR